MTQWSTSEPYTVGIEEEVMLLSPDGWGLTQDSLRVMEAMPEALRERLSAETHLAAIEYASDPHARVGDAVAQLRELRRALDDGVRAIGLAVAGSGTHPFTLWTDTELTPRERYEEIHATTRELARREPTFAQHVHVGVPDPDDAIRLMNRLRTHLPLLLALSANSPFWQGRDTGLASTRIPLWQAFPRTGLPRPYRSYAHWDEVISTLVTCGAFGDESYLWWDIRPSPKFGTVEVRIMDTQTRVDDAGALAALIQAVARLELEEGFASEVLVDAVEVLDENRFLASRDGMSATLIDPEGGCRVPIGELLERLLEAALPHAQDLGCEHELGLVRELAETPGATRQRSLAGEGDDLAPVPAGLATAYVAEAVAMGGTA